MLQHSSTDQNKIIFASHANRLASRVMKAIKQAARNTKIRVYSLPQHVTLHKQGEIEVFKINMSNPCVFTKGIIVANRDTKKI